MSVEFQLKLDPPKREDPQLGLFPVDEEIPIHLETDTSPDQELARWRRRTLFLTSIFIHIFLIIFIIYAPDLIRRGKIMMGIPVEPKQDHQVTTLFLPPDLLKSLRNPPPDAHLSDKNRQAQGKSPVIDPKGLKMPFSRGNTPEPLQSRGTPSPPTPPASAPNPPAGSQQPEPQQPPPKPEPKEDAQLRLEDVAPPKPDGAGKFEVPSMTPGQAIQQSMHNAARGGYHPESGNSGDSISEFNNLHPNFSTEMPTILSDTKGVDFGPYLSRILHIIRENWIAVSPESARLGEKGRVVTVFEILKDGSVPQLRMVSSSGSDPLDRAAVTGVHASVPFPPLPQEFTGNHLVLQLTFLYNLAPPQ
jgi:TonB family protein